MDPREVDPTVSLQIKSLYRSYEGALSYNGLMGTLRRVFGHDSVPWALIGTRIGGNGSYQLPGGP